MSGHPVKPWGDPSEKAYRRGVHQALAMVDRFIHEHLQVDPAAVLDIAASEARSIRYDRAEHRFMMDEILKDVKRRLEEVGGI